MRARIACTALLAATVALPLSGCFGLPFPSDIADQAQEVASQAQEIADAFSNVEYDKLSRLVMRDASTNEVVCEITDQATIEDALAPLSGTNGLADVPGEPAEYLIEVWQPETRKAGQNADDLDEIQILEITTYVNSSSVTLEVCPIGLELSLATGDGTVDELRALAE